MKNIKIAFIALTVVVALITLFIRIPLPSRGYFNFGDVAVVFSGLVLGSLTRKRNFWWGAGAGGIGAALADIIGGFGMFAPITLVANIGLQGAVSEIIPNLIQAGGGIAGGLLAFAAYKKIVKD
jgi:uncharacterized membrane protein